MFEGIQLDLGTSAVLAIVYVAEGFRRVPAGAVVVRRTLWGEWSAGDAPADVACWRLVSYLPPLTTAIVIPAWRSGEDAARLHNLTDASAEPNQEPFGWRSVLLTISSVFLVTLLIVGLPAAAASRGSLGFLIALTALCLLCAIQAVVVARALRAHSTPAPRPSLLRSAIPLLSPFRTPRAPELLREAQLQHAGPISALRELLPRAAFDRQFRPEVYDYLISAQPNAELQAALATDDMHALLRAAPEHSGPFCPRCGRTYVMGANACTTCGIGLTTAS